MAVRAETQIDLTRVDDGTPGSTGPQGPQGWGIVATVERNAFTESQWTTYGTIGHVEGWSGTSSIRNGCRVGDLFLVKGTATDTGRSHELTYRSDTSSGDLHGECINHTYADRGATGATGPEGPQGPAGPGITYVTLQNGDDMNSCIAKDTVYVTSQTAVCNSLLNMPSGFPAGELRLEIEWMGSNDYLVQHLYCKNGAIRKTYLRTYSNGTFGAWTEEGVVYGTSSTAAATAAKTATVDNYELDSKQYFAIKFTNENTASNPTLSINGGTAKAIYTNGVNAAYWSAGATVNFYYDGTYYQVASAPVYASTVTVGNPNGDNVFIGNSGVEVKDGSDTRASFLNDGMRLYDQNSSSDPIASFTTHGAIIGTSSGNQDYYVKINQGELDFYYGSSKRAYLEFFEGNHLNIYSYFPLKINNKVLSDFVTSKGKTGSWYYQKWASGKIEAWSDSISSGTLSMSQSYRLYRTSNTEFTIASGIFDSTPTNAYVTIPYSSGAAIVNALVTCYSSTKLRCQIWKDSNNSSTQQAAVNLKFYVVYFPSTY